MVFFHDGEGVLEDLLDRSEKVEGLGHFLLEINLCPEDIVEVEEDLLVIVQEFEVFFCCGLIGVNGGEWLLAELLDFGFDYFVAVQRRHDVDLRDSGHEVFCNGVDVEAKFWIAQLNVLIGILNFLFCKLIEFH